MMKRWKIGSLILLSAATVCFMAAIVQDLKDSYTLGHRAAKSLTQENCLERVVLDEKNSAPRLFWSTFAISHAYDHYGQMVEYLRMNSIVPPTSRKGN